MKCLNCGYELNKCIMDVFYNYEYRCPCGVKYSKDFVENFDKTEWKRIRRWRLFKVHKYSDGLKTLIFYSIKNRVVHPLHYKLHNLLVKWG